MADFHIFEGCYNGIDFENKVVQLLQVIGFDAKRVGKSDNGVDIVAYYKFPDDFEFTFYIQCKFWNTALNKHPIQEIYTGSSLYEKKGLPVVITNNRVSAEARAYARKLGVEIIANAEFEEIILAYEDKKIINDKHSGLLGLIISHASQDRNIILDWYDRFKKDNNTSSKENDREKLKLEIMNNFDQAEIFLKEASELQLKASQLHQKAVILQKEALLRNLNCP